MKIGRAGPITCAAWQRFLDSIAEAANMCRRIPVIFSDPRPK
jgi:hypothetical protein